MYIIGKTGTGKSSLLANMALSDINNGYGLAVIDPHGDLIDHLLSVIPKHRLEDTVYLDVGSRSHSISFNPLSQIPRQNHSVVVSGLISVFKKIWSEFWGPRLEHILRHSLFTLLDYPTATLLDIPLLLTNKTFRTSVITHVGDEAIRAFWHNEFEKYSPWLRSDAVSPILNKIGQFLTSPILRNIVGQRANKLKFRSLMDQKKIVLINLSKGTVGEDISSLLGSLFSTYFYLSALSRASLDESERIPFYLYIDEFQNFLTHSFSNMLSETRKYGLNLVLAHQFMNQLNPVIRDAVVGNIGTLISFRVGLDDADYLKKEFYPFFTDTDLINLPNYHIILKLMIDGVTSQPFTGHTLPLSLPKESFKESIIKHSQQHYCLPAKLISRLLNTNISNKKNSRSKIQKLF
ncbi:MAG: type IV secretory system conjugative DNA transfer family protein [Melioribacteraceae bacterium]|nr:type IV secretory system conjugative DNA transfer family protein [Melioribacteraceae bacterium]